MNSLLRLLFGVRKTKDVKLCKSLVFSLFKELSDDQEMHIKTLITNDEMKHFDGSRNILDVRKYIEEEFTEFDSNGMQYGVDARYKIYSGNDFFRSEYELKLWQYRENKINRKLDKTKEIVLKYRRLLC
jgi:hypothetical protein